MSFKSAEKKIMKSDNLPKHDAGAILASAARKASPAAVKANPNLKKVGGMGKKGC